MPLICFAFGGIDPVIVLVPLAITFLCIVINGWAAIAATDLQSKHRWLFILAATVGLIWLLLLILGLYWDIIEYGKYNTRRVYSSSYIRRFPLEEIKSEIRSISMAGIVCAALFLFNIFQLRRLQRKKSESNAILS